jgi:hypothetical protein
VKVGMRVCPPVDAHRLEAYWRLRVCVDAVCCGACVLGSCGGIVVVGVRCLCIVVVLDIPLCIR